MLLVPWLSNTCNVAFRSGFAFSGAIMGTSWSQIACPSVHAVVLAWVAGVVNLIFSQATGFSTARAHPESGQQYWNTVGSIVLVGLVCGVYVLLQYVPRAMGGSV